VVAGGYACYRKRYFKVPCRNLAGDAALCRTASSQVRFCPRIHHGRKRKNVENSREHYRCRGAYTKIRNRPREVLFAPRNKKFEERYNGDLANGIGNLVSRVATIGQKLGNIPFNFAEDIVPGTKEKNSSVFALYDEKVAAGRLNEALGVVWELVGFADRYINEQKPWAIKDEAILKTVIINASWCIGSIGNLLAPFLPETSERILSQIKFSKDALEIKKEGTLFPRLKTD